MPQGERLYRIALFDGPGDNEPKPVEVSWDDLLSELSSFKVTECREPDPEVARDGACTGHHCPHKKIEAWSPVDYADDCEARADAAVRAITLAVYDLDGPTPESMADLAEGLQGLRYACHGTHASGSYRLCIALDRTVAPGDWPKVWQTIRTHYKIPADPKCANPSRIYFFPSKPHGRGPGEFYIGEGTPLDLGWLLDLYAATPLPTPKAVAAQAPVKLPENLPPISVDIAKIRKELMRVSRPESAALVAKIFGTEALATPGNRDDTINAAASLVVRTTSDVLTADVVVEILKPSISLMDCAPEGLDHWLGIAHGCASRALKRRITKDTRESHLNQSLMRGLRKTALTEKQSAQSESGEKSGQGQEEDPDGETVWTDGLLCTEDEDGNVKIRQCGANANLICTEDENWKNFLAFNEMSKEIDLLGGPLMGVPKATLHVEAANWLARSQYELILKPQEVGPQLLAVARRNPINPLRDYLLECKSKWLASQRVAKIENLFLDFYGARGDTHYLKAIAKRFMISAVARVLMPGCFVKNVVVLEGAQDTGKSSSLQILGGEFFSDTKIDIHSRDGRMAASRFWIIELAELASLKRADNETVKSFLSARKDDIRLPYGPIIESFPRCCIFVCTTNETEYLTDPTGNTRYWPVTVGAIDLMGLQTWRDLLWGEAVVAFEENERWWFEREETDLLEIAEREQRERTRQSPCLDRVITWMLGHQPERRPQVVDIDEVAVKALGLTADRISEKVRMEIGLALTQLKFRKVRRRIDSIPVWRYEIPPYMRDLAQESKPKAAYMQMVSKMASSQLPNK